MRPTFSFSSGLLLLMLCCGPSAYAQDSGEPEKPSMIERFLAIFQTSPEVEKARLLADSLDVPFRVEDVPTTERYSGIYNLIHSEQNAYYKKLSAEGYTNWDDLNALRQADYISPTGDTAILAKNVKVFGWHPHWMGSAYKRYPFNLLSHISLFSYNVNTGREGTPYDNPQVIEGWKDPDFDLVGLAHADNCKVMITVSNFGARQNRVFLNDLGRQERLIEDVVTLMVEIGADGIDLDFEQVPQNFEKKFSTFVRKLRKRLTAGKGRYKLSVVLPKVNNYGEGNNIYNIDTLQKYVDFFTVTTYDFVTGANKAAPISPLYNAGRNPLPYNCIQDVVFNYLEAGMDRKKLLVGLPYYGGKWTTFYRSEGSPGKDSTAFEHLTYAAIKKANRDVGPPDRNFDAWSSVYKRETLLDSVTFDRVEEITWFDDAETLNTKYDWVLEQELGGIGIWALGYDAPNPELWTLIDDKFAPGTADTIVRYTPPQTLFGLPAKLLNYRDPVGISFIFIFVFLAIGFVFAMFDWRVREVFYHNKTLRIFYIVGSFAIFTATVALFLFFRPEVISTLGPGWLSLFMLVVGLIGGAVLVRTISRWFGGARAERP